MDRNSQIILARNIPMDKNYNNVLSYNTEEVLQMVIDNQVAEDANYSFIRSSGTILVEMRYETCLTANYMAFQNKDYSNKWFFAWIDEVIYKADKTTELKYTVDVWSTWYDRWSVRPCYVIRHHVNDDIVGNYTQDENLDIGDVVQETIMHYSELTDRYWIGVMSSWNPSSKREFSGVTGFNGNFFGDEIFTMPMKADTPESQTKLDNIADFLETTASDGKISSVNGIFIIPEVLIDGKTVPSTGINPKNNRTFYFNILDADFEAVRKDIYFNKVLSFNDYTPKNNKCFVYPWNYMYVTNNIGNSNIYKYENFSDSVQTMFELDMAMTMGISGKLIPRNYKKIGYNHEESLPLPKMPICGWSADAYTNWLTQNCINIATNAVTGIAGGLASSISSPISGALSISSTIGGLVGQFHKAKLLPNIEVTNNTADVNFVTDNSTFTFRGMRVKTEYLRIIDDFFSRFGYKIVRVITPNLTGRKNWNYIEIGESEIIGTGSVPSQYMEIINNVCRKGTTIWHDYNGVGNYTNDNSPV